LRLPIIDLQIVRQDLDVNGVTAVHMVQLDEFMVDLSEAEESWLAATRLVLDEANPLS